MSLKGMILLALLLYSYSCISQSVDKKGNESSIDSLYVSFFLDGKKIKIDNRFNFTIVHKKDTIKARVIGHCLFVPEIADLLDYTIIFKYGKYSLSFHRISKEMLTPDDQNYTWEFGVDNRPFDESLDLMSSQQYETDKITRQLQYLRIQPMEVGDGLRFVNTISYKQK